MEKTVKFHILKEKIIKTNELLQLHLDKTKELEKIQKCYHQLKTALELNKNEIKKLKLKNETLSYNLRLTEKNNAPLKDDYNKLKQQYDQLEEESSKTINNLQIKYQSTGQELQECKEKLATLSQQGFSIETKAKSPVKKTKRRESPVSGNVKQKVNQLLVDNETLHIKNERLKLEIHELQKKVDNSQIFEDESNKIKQVESKLKLKEQELLDLKIKLKVSEETKMEEINRLSKALKNVELGTNKLKTENEKLKNENCSYRIEISMLQGENQDDLKKNLNKVEEENKLLIMEIIKLKDIIRDNNNTPSPEQIDAIMNEIVPPARLSPMSELSEEMLECIDDQLPPLKDNVGPIQKQLPTTESAESHVRSSSGDFTVSAYSNSTEVIKTNKKKLVSKKRNKITKRKSKKIDLFGTLLALKKANLNFIISSDSLTQYNRMSPRFLNNTSSAYTQSESAVVPEKKYPNTVTCNLECDLTCCRNSQMLLKGGVHEDAHLLGFINVKDESFSQSQPENNKNNTLDWPRPVPCHRSTKKRKKVENLNQKSLKKPAKDNKNTKVQNERNIEIKTKQASSGSCNSKPDIALVEEVPQEVISIDESKKLENRKKSVISNEKIIRHSYGTRLSGLRQSVSDPDSPAEAKKRRIARVKKTTTLNSLTATINDDKDDISFPAVASENVQNSQIDPLKIPAEDDGIKNDQSRETLASNHITRQRSPKTVFKRPVCRTRRSSRLVTSQTEIQSNTNEAVSEEVQTEVKVHSPPKCPESPTLENQGCIFSKPKIIPLEQGKIEKIPTSKIEVLFVKLINYSMEEDVLDEVVREFSDQDPEYIAQAILEKISQDYHDTPDSKYNPAPLMTTTQRTMLGFMSKLEKSNVIGVFDSYLTLAERKLLTCQGLQEFAPITRLYLAICKLHQDIQKMRKLCCDVFYFCGDFAVPFLFCVLTSWSEVLPHERNSNDMPLAKVLVQIVYMKDCNKPGYNLFPLRDLLIKFYGYPTERWDSNELFQELFHRYLRNPVRSSDFALLLLCKNHPEKWVHQKIEQHLKPIVDQIPSENFKAAVIILIGNLYNRFSSKSENNYLPSVREWFSSLVTETTPDVVKRSVYLCLTRLQKK